MILSPDKNPVQGPTARCQGALGVVGYSAAPLFFYHFPTCNRTHEG